MQQFPLHVRLEPWWLLNIPTSFLPSEVFFGGGFPSSSRHWQNGDTSEILVLKYRKKLN